MNGTLVTDAMRKEPAGDDWLRELLALPRQESTIAAEIDGLHYFVIITTMLGAAAIALVATAFVIRYRRSPGSTRHRPEWRIPPVLEIGLVFGLAGLFFGWWFIGVQQYIRLQRPPPDALEVYVTAKQWMWKFTYPQGRVSLSTLYVPANKPVKLIFTSRDVIHSFFVPEFRIKQDAVPGRFTMAWFEAMRPGEQFILCTEYCGTGHSTMRGKVVVLRPEDYDAWIADLRKPVIAGPQQRQPSVPYEAAAAGQMDLVELGERIAAEYGCLRCHTTDGSRHIGPSFAGAYGTIVPLEGGERVLADESYLTESMMDPRARIHRGYDDVMPSYQGILQPTETAALLELIRSLQDVEPTEPGLPQELPPFAAPSADVAGPPGQITPPGPARRLGEDVPPISPGRAYPPPNAPGPPSYPSMQRNPQ